MKNYRALVVEDDEDLGLIFSTALRSLNFAEVELIADGAKALAWLAEHEPDLVVLDLHLPKLSGVNLLRQITTELRLINTRVMIVTADTGMAEELRNRADIVLVKPITFTQIRELASRLVPGAGVDMPPGQALAERPETALSAPPDAPAQIIVPTPSGAPGAPKPPAAPVTPSAPPETKTPASPTPAVPTAPPSRPSRPPQQTQPPAAPAATPNLTQEVAKKEDQPPAS